SRCARTRLSLLLPATTRTPRVSSWSRNTSVSPSSRRSRVKQRGLPAGATGGNGIDSRIDSRAPVTRLDPKALGDDVGDFESDARGGLAAKCPGRPDRAAERALARAARRSDPAYL